MTQKPITFKIIKINQFYEYLIISNFEQLYFCSL